MTGAPGYIFTENGNSTVNFGNGVNFGKAMYHFKELLKAAGWTHVQSYDGTNLSTTFGNSHDQVGSETEMDTTNSWIALSSPSVERGAGYPGNRTLCVGRGTTSASWIIVYAPPGTDGTRQTPSADGTTGSIPTWTTSTAAVGTLPNTRNTSWTNTLTTNTRHAGAMSIPPYNFYLVGQDSSGDLQSATICGDCMVPGTYDPLDIDPFVVYTSGPTDTSNIIVVDPLTVAGQVGGRCYIGRGLSWETVSTVSAVYYGLDTTVSNLKLVPSGLGSSPYGSSTWRGVELPFIWAFGGQTNASGIIQAGSPLGNSAGIRWPYFLKGRSSLLKWKLGALMNGQMVTYLLTNDYVVLGDVMLPHDGATQWSY